MNLLSPPPNPRPPVTKPEFRSALGLPPPNAAPPPYIISERSRVHRLEQCLNVRYGLLWKSLENVKWYRDTMSFMQIIVATVRVMKIETATLMPGERDDVARGR